MRLSILSVCMAATLAACGNPMSLLKPVDDARKAVKARYGDDWNITLPIVNGSGDQAVVCGYAEPPHSATPGSSPPLADEHLFIWADKQLTMHDDIGAQAFDTRADKDCKGLMRVKTVEPRMVDLPQ
jgi:hypothetical protein